MSVGGNTRVGRILRTARGEDVNGPHGVEPAQRQEREHGRQQRHHRLGHEHQRAAIQCVRRHAADHGEEKDGADSREADEPERERATIVPDEQRHVPQHGRRLHEGSGEGNQEPRPEQSHAT